MWYKLSDKHLELFIFAKPNAKKTMLVKITHTALHITIHARPQDGEANSELIRYLAKLLSVPKTDISLLKGVACRHKVVRVPLVDSVLRLINTKDSISWI